MWCLTVKRGGIGVGTWNNGFSSWLFYKNNLNMKVTVDLNLNIISFFINIGAWIVPVSCDDIMSEGNH